MKRELNSKDELIKSLTDTQTAILDTIGKPKVNEEKRHFLIEPKTVLTLTQQGIQSLYKKHNIYWKPRLKCGN